MKLSKYTFLITSDCIPPPFLLLAGYVCYALNLDIRIDKEQRDHLPMARLRGTNQFERLYLVLQDVEEGDKPALLGINSSDLLHHGSVRLAPEDCWEPVMTSL